MSQPRQNASAAAMKRLAAVTIRSEIARVIVVNSAPPIMATIVLASVAIGGNSLGIPPVFLLSTFPLLLLGAAVVWYLRKLAAAGRAIPGWLSIVLAAFESLLPTGLMIAFWKSGALSPVRALTSPPLLGYGLVLVLAPLRLDPRPCLLLGTIAALGHVTLVVISNAAHDAGTMMYGYGGWIFVGGLAAAFVAREIRRYVLSEIDQAIERSRIEKEISAAADVQRGLLPRQPPAVNGYKLAFWNRPAEKTGGDYYDWQMLPDGRVAVSLADVSGHGLGPALMAAFCRAYARAALSGGSDLGTVVRQINLLLAADLPAGQFVTFAVALITPGSPQIKLLSAGHGPILIHRAAGAVESVDSHAIPLGVDTDEPFDTAGELQMSPGDALIMVTDGFVEWRRDSDREMFGQPRLCAAIAEAADAHPAQTITAMRTAVEAFAAGSTQSDDLTAVVVRFTEL